MKDIYEDVFAEVISIVRDSRDGCVQRMEDYSKGTKLMSVNSNYPKGS